MSDQTQKAGDNSTNVQAGSIIVYQGPSVAEVRQLALDVFRANFFELAGDAKNIAKQRAEEVTEAFLNSYSSSMRTGLDRLRNPISNTLYLRFRRNMRAAGIKTLAICW